MYYLLSLNYNFHSVPAVVFTILASLLSACLLLKFLKSLTQNISWKNIILMNIIGLASYFATAAIAIKLQLYQVVNIIFELFFGFMPTQTIVVLFALVPFLINFLLWTSVVLAWIIHQKTHKKISQSNRKYLLTSWISLFLAPVFMIVIVIVVGQRSNSWQKTIYTEFHKFNAHFKDLCVERTDLSECPKTEAELKAFDPQGYEKLARYTKLKYVYDYQTNDATWYVFTPFGQVFVSNKQYYPAYGNLNHRDINL